MQSVEITAFTRTGFSRHLHLRDVDTKAYVDLTGFDFLFRVKAARDQAVPDIEATIGNGRITLDADAMGFTIDLPGSAFATMTPGTRYYHSLVCYAPGGADETLFEGRMILVQSL